MANRNANFTFAPGVPTGNQTATTLLFLSVRDSANVLVYGPGVITGGNTSAVVPLPVGVGYKATLEAHDGLGAVDANPPTVTFDVPAPPPPPVPPDPILHPPTIS